MGLFDRFRKSENRADLVATNVIEYSESALVTALIGTNNVAKEQILAIPEVQYCLMLIGGTIASLPIRLYDKKTTEEIEDDPRVSMLNVDTGDTLSATQFWKAMIEDYFLAPHGAFAYVHKEQGTFKSLHYIDSINYTINKNIDPIFKDYSVNIAAKSYMPYEFFKIMRKTKDGVTNDPLQSEANLALACAYYCYKLQSSMMKKGGTKKGFLKAERRLEQGALDALKAAFRRLYSDEDSEGFVVLNAGIDFKEAAATSAELQLADLMSVNKGAVLELFGVVRSDKAGTGRQFDEKETIRTITNIIADIEASLNRDLLREDEKDYKYFAFDTRELTRGSIKERYEAYASALSSHWMNIDEVRTLEDMKPLGVNWITLGLNDVLLDPTTGSIYTPNTKEHANLNEHSVDKSGISEEGGEADESGIES